MENINIKFKNSNYENKRVNIDFFAEKIKDISYKSNFVESRKELNQPKYAITKDSRVFDE